MSRVDVKSVLSEDGDCINLLTVGQVVKLLVSVTESALERDEDSESTSFSLPEKAVVTGCATNLLTGECSSDPVRVERMVHGQYWVTFTPELDMKSDYTLAVLHEGENVIGSPYCLRFIDAEALSYVHVERRGAVIDAGRPMNLIVPLKEKGELDVSVEGPFGRCETTAKHHTFDEESLSLRFIPKGAGAYTVTVTVDQEEIGNCPFLMLADFSAEEALECHVFPEDRPLFEKPIRFRQSNGEVSFRVSTVNALQRSRGPGELSVTCSGPGKVAVSLAQSPEERGVEICTLEPLHPGNYQVSILWNGQHIMDSPYTLQFRKPRSKITSNGLNLHQKLYHLQVPYRFRLNCSEFDMGPEIECSPAEAARIDVTPIEGTKGMHRCEVLPLLEGTHSISVKIRGKEIEGSPFPVTFEDSCNPSECKIVDSTTNYELGGYLMLKISTVGAGLGELEATAEDPDTKIVVTLEKKQLSDSLYQLELDPGQMSVCCLSVTYGKQHIPGSPYRLIFNDPSQFSLKGGGLLGGVVDCWNVFTLQVATPPQGKLNVRVGAEDGGEAEANVTALSDVRFEVRYFPPSPGNYVIDARLGQIPIPGSPFRVKCSSIQFQLEDAPKRAKVGAQVEVKVHQTGGCLLGEDESLEVVSKTLKGKELRGVAVLTDNEKQVYTCTLNPTIPGNYMVSIKWNRLHIKGSPFSLKVVSPPKPECVRVHGVGVKGGEAGQGVEFTVETAEAGGGLLAMRIHAPARELQFDTVQDPSSRRTLHVCYCPPVSGEYTVEVTWSGIHVPGSPFRVTFLPPAPQTEIVVVAEVHPDHEAHSPEDVRPEGNEVACPEYVSPEGERPESLCPELSSELGRPESVSVTIEEEAEVEKNESLSPLHPSNNDRASAEIGDVSLAPPTLQSYEIESLECGKEQHVTVQVEERADSAYASASERNTGSFDRMEARKFLPAQESVESTYSLLYTVQELSSRRASEDQIAIHLEGELSFS